MSQVSNLVRALLLAVRYAPTVLFSIWQVMPDTALAGHITRHCPPDKVSHHILSHALAFKLTKECAPRE
jgi:hypothetical protein